MTMTSTPALLDGAILRQAAFEAVRKLNPRQLVRNPVIFVTEVVSILVTLLAFRDALSGNPWSFQAGVAAWLWLTVLFATFAEAVAEGRGKARAASLRASRGETMARWVPNPDDPAISAPRSASELRRGDHVIVEAGEIIPSDGEVVQGIASVNESAVTGESAPVIREAGGDRSAVTGGTLVVSDRILVRITSEPGSTFLDRMIAMVEGASRQKTPNEIALDILLAGMTIVFLIAVATLVGFASYSGSAPSVVVLSALLVTLIPTTIGGLLSAIGIAGMDRLVRFNVLATSGRAVEAAGDVDVLLLDKTGTITFGNRQAAAFITAPGVHLQEVAEAAVLASLADETPEGRSILAFAKEKYGIDVPGIRPADATPIPFTAQTRISGMDLPQGSFRKGAVDSLSAALNQSVPPELAQGIDRIARAGATPLAVAKDGRILGAIELKDIVKPGIRERFAELRRMGIRTVMVTGDNRLTAAAIAAEAGVDDFLAEAKPQDKLDYIRAQQGEGRLVAMAGDGTNDAPALAQADVGLAMQTGTQAAREAGNMVDLDSDPTKLIEVVEIGKQLLITRGALTTFSIANDVAKYFAILPAIFVAQYPGLMALNVMRLTSPQSAILSAVIFNALIIAGLVPLALRGVAYAPVGAAALLRRNLLIYGLGGLVAPFIGIKIIDVLLTFFGVA
ncbi:potassium-transporting ATPase subunit KdpB [Roseococcus pinisoli]|uniref:Potassium-transporting ATPase ATP-binding subunit n=1 Tax=Roseococcus pinisoli TaxID=2835040 RepID=A0ABS5QDY5_9PROT|nr:potassium-transporting ATPase subunit KdpB [Roseococcus pinisoli]MBS7811881.1 potassium-transporting ATPase subunit KdpB [Roseococcus pinisoli]